jgi:hypothetical protein
LRLALLRELDNEAVQFLLDLGVAPEEASRRVGQAVGLLQGVLTREDFESRRGTIPRDDDRNRFAGG